jgi:hypothetical protein
MKKGIITPILYFVCLNFSFGQCSDVQMYDIYTPVGTYVKTHLMCEASTPTRKAYDDNYKRTYPNAQQIIVYDNLSSTRKFNCHGYAWLRVEQGIDRWIGYDWNDMGTYPDIYTTDGSYTQVSSETFPGKVFWNRPGDHTAITTEQPGWFISKWNQYPLFRHRWNDSPYGTSFKYYIKNCSLIIDNQTITSNKDFLSCGTINFKNVTISSGVTVNIHAQDAVILEPGFHAVAGSNVTITAGGQTQSSSSPNPSRTSLLSDSDNTESVSLLKELTIETVEIESTGVDFSVFPNPNDGNFTVKIIGEIQPYTVEIFNNLGGHLGFVNCNGDAVNINRADLNPGIYYLKLTMSGKISVKKIIVQ